MSIRLGTNIISGRSTYQPSLFDYKWADHTLNDPQWARGDNFAWHSSTIYTAAYDHLVADIEGKTPQADYISGIYITYYLANDGHKVCMPDQEEFLIQLYNTTGSAWYYILDTVTQSFKVPREVSQSAPSEKALYFYIGNFTQTALENTAGANLADIEDVMDEAVDNITGLLNTKVTVGHEVIAFQVPTADNDYTWYRKYADGWVEQGGIINWAGATMGSGTTTSVAAVSFPVEITKIVVLSFGDNGQFFNFHARNSSGTGMDVYASNQLPVSFTQTDCEINWQVSGIAATE